MDSNLLVVPNHIWRINWLDLLKTWKLIVENYFEMEWQKMRFNERQQEKNWRVIQQRLSGGQFNWTQVYPPQVMTTHQKKKNKRPLWLWNNYTSSIMCIMSISFKAFVGSNILVIDVAALGLILLTIKY